MIIAIIDETIDETVRTAVIGELSFNKFLNSYLGLDRFPLDLKYMIVTIIAEIVQAKLRESAVLFVGEILMNVVLNKINKRIILRICSMNSVMLIAKNFFRPQSAPRKTS